MMAIRSGRTIFIVNRIFPSSLFENTCICSNRWTSNIRSPGNKAIRANICFYEGAGGLVLLIFIGRAGAERSCLIV